MPITVKAIREQLEPFRPEHISSGNIECRIDKIVPLGPAVDAGAQDRSISGCPPGCRRAAR
jgi:hypothetical protein